MKVLIRVDASVVIGSGHVMRCLTLAKALRARNAQVLFACRELSGHLLVRIAAEGFGVIALPAVYPGEPALIDVESLIAWQEDLAALQHALQGQTDWDWLLLDHYGLDEHWEGGARSLTKRIAVIDDLANRPHDADLLLNQNLTAERIAYADLLAENCQFLLGPHHALLHPAFAESPIDPKPVVRRVLVSFGGVDAGGETLKAMDALAELTEFEVDFVAGAANPAWDRLVARVAGRDNWRLHRHVDDFAALMRSADLFVGAGGGTSWERAALGLPTLCIAVAANQQANAERLAAAGVHLYLGKAETVAVAGLREAIRLLVSNFGLRQSLSARSRALVDGHGTRRVAAAMLTCGLSLHPATLDDARLLFDGRNAAQVRRWSLNDEPIAWDTHLRWLHSSLSSPDRLLLIGVAADGPVGVLRYDLVASQPARAVVSIYLFAGRAGAGWGQALLAQGDRLVLGHWAGLTHVEALVCPANTASLRLFVQAGYQLAECHFVRTF